jgi:hypothetical protein
MRIDATRLTLAVLGPWQIEAVDALAFKVGKRVVAVVIPEFRMNQLLRKYCRAFRPLRPIDMSTLKPSAPRAAPKLDEVAELINEADFAKIYADAMGESQLLEGEIIEERPREEDAPVVGGLLEPEATVDHSPLSFAQAQAALQQSSDREDLALNVLRFARSKFKRALLLSVRGDLVTGWQGLGPGVHQRAVLRIGVSLREANTFKLVRDLRSHFVGPMKRTPGMAVFYSLLGGEFPTTAVVLPLLVRGKPVHLLYLDEGPNELTPPDVGELLILSQGVARSYETLIRKRQASRLH